MGITTLDQNKVLDNGLLNTILLSLDGSASNEDKFIRLPLKVRPRKSKRGEGKKLSMLDAEPIPSSGDCPGGKYFYIDNRDNLLALLRRWTERKAWVAIDLETGVAWREKPDPESDDMIRYYEEVIDPYTCPIYLVSLSVEPGVALVFDVRPLKNDQEFLQVWREFLTTCRFVAHNSMFEQCFLTVHFGVMVNIVYDTMLVHQLMTAGLDISSSLGDMLTRYCGLTLDKQWQKFFLSLDHRSPIPAECIAYSAGDVCQLLALAKMLEVELRESGLHPIWTTYEQPFMKWVALAKVEGIGVDRDFFASLNAELTTAIAAVLKEFDSCCPGVLISSPAQIKTWFASQGIDLRSTGVAAIEKLKELPEVGRVAALILTCRKLQKMKGTYVEPMLYKLPSPVTTKIHPNWGQLFTVTGRMNCKEPNFQNMPSRDEWVKIRKGFIAKSGHLLAYCDYSQYEVRAMADMSGEERMIEVFIEAEAVQNALRNLCQSHGLPSDIVDLAEKDAEKYAATVEEHPQLDELVKRLANLDFHRRTASMLFGVAVEEVTKAQRSKAKTITFAKPYGAGPKKIAQAAGIEVQEAYTLFKDYDEKFPKLAAFLEQCREQAKQGSTQSPSGRKRFYQQPVFANIMARVKAVYREGGKDWEEMIETWGSTDVYEITNKLFNAKIGSIEREGMNMPIQACVHGTTRVFVKGIGYKEIRELEGQEVDLWDGTQFSRGTVAITGMRPVVELKTYSGNSILCTADHRFLVRSPEGKERWVEAERLGQLDRNSRVVLGNAVTEWHETLQLPPIRDGLTWNSKRIDILDLTDRTRLGEWMGRLVSDGGTTISTAYLLVAEHEVNILPALSGSCSVFGHVSYSQQVKPGYTSTMHKLAICSRTLSEQLRLMGIKCQIPEFIWSDRDLLIGYLRGMFDGDGGVSTDSAVLTFGKDTKNIPWAAQIQQALLLLGIRSRLRHYKGDRTVVQIQKCDMPIFSSIVGFINPAKQDKALAVRSEISRGQAVYGKAVSVKSVIQTGLWASMYDFMDSSTGQFMANGFVVHNCNADATKQATVLASPRLQQLDSECRIIAWVHDEIILTAPEHLVYDAANILRTAMIEAAKILLTRTPVDVSFSVGKCWGK